MIESAPTNFKCPECGIEARVEGTGTPKSFAIPQDEMARRCKHYSANSICPNVQKALDWIRDSMISG